MLPIPLLKLLMEDMEPIITEELLINKIKSIRDREQLKRLKASLDHKNIRKRPIMNTEEAWNLLVSRNDLILWKYYYKNGLSNGVIKLLKTEIYKRVNKLNTIRMRLVHLERKVESFKEIHTNCGGYSEIKFLIITVTVWSIGTLIYKCLSLM